MAESVSKSFKTSIEIGGKLQSTLGSAVARANALLKSVGSTAKIVGSVSGKMFSTMGKGLALVQTSVKSLLSSLGPLLLAWAGFSTISSFFHTAKESFDAAEVGASNLEASLRNNRILAKQGEEAIQRQIKALKDLAATQSNNSVFGVGTLRSAQASLATFHGGAKEWSAISSGFENYLAGTSGINATGDDASAAMEKIGRAVKTGNLGRFAKELGLNAKTANKEFSKLSTGMERLDYLNRHINDRFGGRASALFNTDEGQIKRANNQIAKFFRPWGEAISKVQAAWTKLVAKILNLPSVTKLSSKIQGLLNKAASGIEGLLGNKDFIGKVNEIADVFSSAIDSTTKFFQSASGQQLVKTLGDIYNTLQNVGKAWATLEGGFLSGAWNAIVAAWNGAVWAWNALSVSFTAAAKELQELWTKLKPIREIIAGLASATLSNLASSFSGLLAPINDLLGPLKSVWSMISSIAGASFNGTKGYLNSGNNSAQNTMDSIMSQHAKGGVFSSPHLAQIAEGGKSEAVIPLHRSARNLGLLNYAAASMGVSGGSGGHSFTFQVGNISLANGTAAEANRAARQLVKSAADMFRDVVRDDGRTSLG